MGFSITGAHNECLSEGCRATALYAEIERLQEAKRRALAVADERSKENVQTAFAAIDRNDKSRHILAWTIRGSATLVRQAIGFSWLGDDWEAGWKSAKSDGMRVVKIKLSLLAK